MKCFESYCKVSLRFHCQVMKVLKHYVAIKTTKGCDYVVYIARVEIEGFGGHSVRVLSAGFAACLCTNSEKAAF